MAAASPGKAAGFPQGEKGRRAFLDEVDFTALNNLRSGKVALSQWMSFPKMYHMHRDFLPARAFVLLGYVVDK